MRWVAGLLLISAAALKAAGLWNDPTATMVHPFGTLIPAIQVGLEFAVGLLVLNGVYWRALRWFVTLLFSGFAAYSLYLAVNGAASCGCFGPVHVNPWWTFVLDSAVVLGLVISSILDVRNPIIISERDDIRLWAHFERRSKVIAGVMAVSVITAALLVRSIDRRSAVAHGVSEMADGLVILEPEQWVGQKLPIAEFVDVDLSSGEWTVVLHRHDCPACQEAVRHYEKLASTGSRIALVEVPPYGRGLSDETIFRNCRLKDDREWFVQTPVEIRLQDGVVTAVKADVH